MRHPRGGGKDISQFCKGKETNKIVAKAQLFLQITMSAV